MVISLLLLAVVVGAVFGMASWAKRRYGVDQEVEVDELRMRRLRGESDN